MPSADASAQRRVRFDFEIEFLNGGGLQGQDFRLDIDGDDIGDDALAELIVRDLRLLMVGTVRILNKVILTEPHKRPGTAEPAARAAATDGGASLRSLRRFIDLSHTIEAGMVTYPGLPEPRISDHLSRADSRAHYADGTEFQIGRIEMVANTGTYLDSPFHRFADAPDLSQLDLAALADLPGVVVRVSDAADRAIGRAAFLPIDVRGRAVLVHTGWDRHWRTPAYGSGHPFLTADAAAHLRDQGAALVGIDSLNIDDTADLRRPVHTTLLAAGIPIVEHMRGLEQLPPDGFRFSAVPPRIRGMGSFPVRAYAVVEA